MSNKNPKGLDIEMIKASKTKTTIGFTTAPDLKLKLAEEAQSLGISLSEHVESIVVNYDRTAKQGEEKPKEETPPIETATEPPVKEVVPEKVNENDKVKPTCFNNLEDRLTALLEEQLSPVLEKIDELKELQISKTVPSEEMESDVKVKTLTLENESLKKELSAIANNKGLKALFEQYKGKTLEYQTPDKQVKKIAVNSLSDVITALVETSIDNPKN